MASNFQQTTLRDIIKNLIDFDGSTWKAVLLKNTYTPNPDHDFASDVASYECDATNYTGGYGGGGRKTCANPAATEDDSNNRVKLDADDPATWTSLGGGTNNTLRYVAIIKEITSDAASPLLCVLDMGSDKTTNGGDFTVQFSANGIGYISC